jgi:hypothetical protein
MRKCGMITPGNITCFRKESFKKHPLNIHFRLNSDQIPGNGLNSVETQIKPGIYFRFWI